MDAAMARRRLVPERGKFVGTTDIQIDWAHPEHVPQNVVSFIMINLFKIKKY